MSLRQSMKTLVRILLLWKKINNGGKATMEYIYNKMGNIIRYSRNDRCIRRYLNESRLLVDFVSIVELSGGGGFFHVRFDNGDYYSNTWVSYKSLKIAVRQWRNLYGANLYLQGRRCGVVSYHNPFLW